MAAQASQAAFAGNERKVGQRTVGPVGEHLLDDGVAAVLLLSLEHLEGRVSEHGVVTPGGKQLALACSGPGAEVFDPADDQPGGDLLSLPRGERGVLGLGDLGVGDPAAQLVIPDRAGQRIGVQAPAGMAAIAAFTLGSIRTVTEKNAPARRTAPVKAAE